MEPPRHGLFKQYQAAYFHVGRWYPVSDGGWSQQPPGHAHHHYDGWKSDNSSPLGEQFGYQRIVLSGQRNGRTGS